MRERAYLLWERSDRRHGDTHYWHEAEREIDAQIAAERAPVRRRANPPVAAKPRASTTATAKAPKAPKASKDAKASKKSGKTKDADAPPKPKSKSKPKPKPKAKPKESSSNGQ